MVVRYLCGRSDDRETLARLRHGNSEAEAKSLLRGGDFQPDQEAVVEGFPALLNSHGGSGTVQVVHYGINHVRLRVTAPHRQYLVNSDVHYPGWKAYVDGQQQPLFYTNVTFRGLVVPAGEHAVEMRFSPASLWWPAATSLAAWLLRGILWWWSKARRKPVAPGKN